jgi:hypothetical protein
MLAGHVHRDVHVLMALPDLDRAPFNAFRIRSTAGFTPSNS